MQAKRNKLRKRSKKNSGAAIADAIEDEALDVMIHEADGGEGTTSRENFWSGDVIFRVCGLFKRMESVGVFVDVSSMRKCKTWSFSLSLQFCWKASLEIPKSGSKEKLVQRKAASKAIVTAVRKWSFLRRYLRSTIASARCNAIEEKRGNGGGLSVETVVKSFGINEQAHIESSDVAAELLACLHDVDANDVDGPDGDEDESPENASAIVPVADGVGKRPEIVYVEKLTQYHGDAVKQNSECKCSGKPICTHDFLRKLLEDVQIDADKRQNATVSTVAQVLEIVQPSLCTALSGNMLKLAVHCQPLVGVDVAQPTIQKTFGPDCAKSIDAFFRLRSSYAFKILVEICGDETPFAEFNDTARLASVASSLSKLAGIRIVSALDRKLGNCQWTSMWPDMLLVGMDGNSDDMLVRVTTFVDENLAVLQKNSECIANAIVEADNNF